MHEDNSYHHKIEDIFQRLKLILDGDGGGHRKIGTAIFLTTLCLMSLAILMLNSFVLLSLYAVYIRWKKTVVHTEFQNPEAIAAPEIPEEDSSKSQASLPLLAAGQESTEVSEQTSQEGNSSLQKGVLHVSQLDLNQLQDNETPQGQQCKSRQRSRSTSSVSSCILRQSEEGKVVNSPRRSTSRSRRRIEGDALKAGKHFRLSSKKRQAFKMFEKMHRISIYRFLGKSVFDETQEAGARQLLEINPNLADPPKSKSSRANSNVSEDHDTNVVTESDSSTSSWVTDEPDSINMYKENPDDCPTSDWACCMEGDILAAVRRLGLPVRKSLHRIPSKPRLTSVEKKARGTYNTETGCWIFPEEEEIDLKEFEGSITSEQVPNMDASSEEEAALAAFIRPGQISISISGLETSNPPSNQASPIVKPSASPEIPNSVKKKGPFLIRPEQVKDFKPKFTQHFPPEQDVDMKAFEDDSSESEAEEWEKKLCPANDTDIWDEDFDEKPVTVAMPRCRSAQSSPLRKRFSTGSSPKQTKFNGNSRRRSSVARVVRSNPEKFWNAGMQAHQASSIDKHAYLQDSGPRCSSTGRIIAARRSLRVAVHSNSNTRPITRDQQQKQVKRFISIRNMVWKQLYRCIPESLSETEVSTAK